MLLGRAANRAQLTCILLVLLGVVAVGRADAQVPGKWSAVEPVGGWRSDIYGWAYGLSCPAPGSCTAVGGLFSYSGPPGTVPWTAVGTGTNWPSPITHEVPTDYMPRWGSTLPLDGAVFDDVSCRTRDSCLAVGAYSRGPDATYPLRSREQTRSWERPTGVPLPTDAQTERTVAGELTAVECVRGGPCTVAGWYERRNHTPQLMVGGETAGQWQPLRGLLLPSNAKGGLSIVGREPLACAKAGFCTIIHGYMSGSTPRSMVADEKAGVWGRGRELSAPRDSDPKYQLNWGGISCPQLGQCVAVGSYQLASAFRARPMIATESGGKWRSAGADAPTDAAATSADGFDPPQASFRDVACSSPGACVAVGDYLDRQGNHEAMAAVETRGRWSRAFRISPPRDASTTTQDASLQRVSCSNDGSCTAAGFTGLDSWPERVFFSSGRLGAGTTGSTAQCDPGDDTRAWNIFKVTVRCLVSGQAFSDPDLAPKDRCIVNLGFDIIPFGKLKAAAAAIKFFRAKSAALAVVLSALKLRSIDRKVIRGLDAVGTSYKIFQDPFEAIQVVATSRLVLRGVRATLTKGRGRYPKALKLLKETQAAGKDLVTMLSGAGDVISCKRAFSSGS